MLRRRASCWIAANTQLPGATGHAIQPSSTARRDTRNRRSADRLGIYRSDVHGCGPAAIDQAGLDLTRDPSEGMRPDRLAPFAIEWHDRTGLRLERAGGVRMSFPSSRHLQPQDQRLCGRWPVIMSAPFGQFGFGSGGTHSAPSISGLKKTTVVEPARSNPIAT